MTTETGRRSLESGNRFGSDLLDTAEHLGRPGACVATSRSVVGDPTSSTILTPDR